MIENGISEECFEDLVRECVKECMDHCTEGRRVILEAYPEDPSLKKEEDEAPDQASAKIQDQGPGNGDKSLRVR